VSVVRQSTLEVCTAWPAAEALTDSSVTWKAVKRAQIPAVKEPTGLLRSDGKRPDGATLIRTCRTAPCCTEHVIHISWEWMLNLLNSDHWRLFYFLQVLVFVLFFGYVC